MYNVPTFDFPTQRKSYKEKISNNNEWGKNIVNSIVTQNHTLYNQYSPTSDYDRMVSNYKLYNNQIDQSDFENTLNPMGIQAGQVQDNVKPYNKAYNKIQVLLGDELSRPFDFRVVIEGDQGVAARNKTISDLLKAFVWSQINQQAQSMGFSTEEIDNVVPPDKIEHYMSHSYVEAREKLARTVFEFLIKKLSLKEKMNEAFKHALISGYEYVWVGVDRDEPACIPLNPLGVIRHKSPDVKYIEDGLYAGYRTVSNVSDILDKYGDFLSEQDIETLQSPSSVSNSSLMTSKEMNYVHSQAEDAFLRTNSVPSSDMGTYGPSSYGDWPVYHVEWRSQKKVGFIEYINEHGDPQVDIVSEDFKVPPYATSKRIPNGPHNPPRIVYMFDDMTLYWAWIPEVWEAVRIGESIFPYIRPKSIQFREIDNPYSVKLGYHGLAYSNTNSPAISLMDRMKPFLYLYLVVMHKLEKLIARDRGKVYHFDTTMIPENMSIAKVMYYLEEMDIDFFNPLMNAEKPGAFQRGKIATSTDRSNMNQILNYISLLDNLDFQISDVAGVNRQREGQIQSEEAVSNSRANIVQSAIITEAAYFYPHYLMWERVFRSLLHLTIQNWKGRKIAYKFVLDDLSASTLELSPTEFDDVSLGLFLSNAQKDNEAFNSIKSYMTALVQADRATFTDLVKLFKAKSIAELERLGTESEQRQQANQMEQIRAANEAQQRNSELMLALEDKKAENRLLQLREQNISELERLILALESKQQTDQDVLQLNKAKLELEKLKAQRDYEIELKKLKQ